MTTPRRPLRLARRVVFWVVLLALVVRVWGCLGQGLPYCFYPDEKNNVERALAMGARQSLDPHWFNKPALGYYVLFAEYGMYYATGRVLGTWNAPEEFACSYFNDPSPFYVIGRLSTALFGALTVLLVFFIGRRFGRSEDQPDRTTGLLTALALTFTVGHAASSQQVKMDVPSAFFTAWSALYLLRIQASGRWRDYLLAGFLAGLGTATKYYSVALMAPLLYVHLFRSREAVLRSPRVILSPRLFGACGALLGGFFAGSPYNFLNPKWFDERLVPQWNWLLRRFGLWSSFEPPQKGSIVEPAATTFADSIEFLMESLVSSRGLGVVLTAFATWGIVRLVSRRRWTDGFLLITTFWLLVFLAVASQQFPAPRHLCVVYPFAAVLAAVGFKDVALRVGRRFRGQAPSEGAIVGAFLVMLALPIPGFPGRATVSLDLERAAGDPRLDVVSWLETNVPADTTIITHLQWVLRPSRERCEWVPPHARHLARQGLIDKVYRDTLIRRWSLQHEALDAASRRSWDTVILLNSWQTEKLRGRAHAAAAYNQIWPRSPWGFYLRRVLRRQNERDAERHRSGLPREPFGADDAERSFRELVAERRPRQRDLKPVEYWTQATEVSAPWLVKKTDGTLALPRYFLAAKSTYENFQSPHKRAQFPDFARFYDDLAAHYDSIEFNGGHPDPTKVLRLWDLSKRVAEPKVTRLDL